MILFQPSPKFLIARNFSFLDGWRIMSIEEEDKFQVGLLFDSSCG